MASKVKPLRGNFKNDYLKTHKVYQKQYFIDNNIKKLL